MYETIIARFNEEMKPFEKTYVYEEQTMYEDFNDVMTSKSCHKDELIKMASFEIFNRTYNSKLTSGIAGKLDKLQWS
jgi:hypothetical protein